MGNVGISGSPVMSLNTVARSASGFPLRLMTVLPPVLEVEGGGVPALPAAGVLQGELGQAVSGFMGVLTLLVTWEPLARVLSMCTVTEPAA